MGRERELSALEAILGQLEQGDGGTVSIVGGPGLGKSRLLAELAASARQRGLRVMVAHGREIERDFPYAIVLDLFAGVVSGDERARLLCGSAELATPLFTVQASAPGQTADDAAFAHLHGLYWLVVNLSAERPLLLCVDDLHWADVASTRFLAYLAGRISGLPVVLAFTTRPTRTVSERWAPSASRTLSLRPLDRAHVDEALRASLPDATDDFCAACFEVTGGNPFHIQEVLLEVAAERLSPGDTDGIRRLSGRAIGRTALFRVLRLDPDTRRVATALAILDDGARIRHVIALTGLDAAEVALALDALAGDGILRPGEPLTFVHPSIREAITADIPSAARALAHRRAAGVLAAEGAAPELVSAQLLLASGMGESWAVHT
ncbi:MAG: ATP-binding protein, partial [Jatrophihabitantaceae bacterium]